MNYYSILSHIHHILGPDHVQMTKVNCKLKVNWNDVAQKYKNILQLTLLVLNHVL